MDFFESSSYANERGNLVVLSELTGQVEGEKDYRMLACFRQNIDDTDTLSKKKAYFALPSALLKAYFAEEYFQKDVPKDTHTVKQKNKISYKRTWENINLFGKEQKWKYLLHLIPVYKWAALKELKFSSYKIKL